MDPDGMFETEADAKKYAKDHNIKTGWFSRTFLGGSKIAENKDGTWSIDNKREGSSISNDIEFGILKGSLITDNKISNNSISDGLFMMMAHMIVGAESVGKSINESNGNFDTGFDANVITGTQSLMNIGIDVATIGILSNSVGDGIGNGNSKNTLKLPTIKLLRGRGGHINGITISKGSGYGSKPRFDIHPLKRTMKSRKESKMTIPEFMDGWYLPHYHRGKGNNLKYHRPWEVGPNGKRKW